MAARWSFLGCRIPASCASSAQSSKTRRSALQTRRIFGYVHLYQHPPQASHPPQNNYVQCGQCGICGTTVTDPCGTCRRAGEFNLSHGKDRHESLIDAIIENDERGGSDYDREQSAQRRRANLDAKFQRSRPDGTELIGIAVSLEEMQTIRATQGFASTNQRTQVPHCTVYYECRRSDSAKHIDQMLGTGVIFFPEVNTMLGTL